MIRRFLASIRQAKLEALAAERESLKMLRLAVIGYLFHSGELHAMVRGELPSIYPGMILPSRLSLSERSVLFPLMQLVNKWYACRLR